MCSILTSLCVHRWHLCVSCSHFNPFISNHWTTLNQVDQKYYMEGHEYSIWFFVSFGILISSKKWSSKIYQRYVFFSPPEEYIHHFNSYMIFNTIKKIMFYYQVTLVCFSAKSRSIPGLHPTPDTRSTTHFTPGIKLLNMTYFYFHWLWSVQCLNCILNLYFVMGNNI